MNVKERTNNILARVRSGEQALGFQIAFCSPDLVEMMGIAGADYVFIDGEHGSFSLGDTGWDDTNRSCTIYRAGYNLAVCYQRCHGNHRTTYSDC